MVLVSRGPSDIVRFGCAALLAACSRAPLPWTAAELAPGALVVSELRGDQSGADGYGEWIEIYDDAGADIDLAGVEIELLRIDGSARAIILIRDSLVVSAGGYLVVGRFAPGAEPAHVDAGWLLPCADAPSGCDDPWLDGGLYDAAAIEVRAREVVVDRAIYRDLPSTGSWALDGAAAPTADGNDDETAWCADQRPDGQSTELGLRGSPGEDNPPC